MRLEIRQHQHVDTNSGAPQVVSCNVLFPSGITQATYIPGTVPNPAWVDITDSTEGLDKLKLTFKEGENGFKQREKGSSSMLTIVGSHSQMIKDWILGTPCSILNYFDARLTDEVCGIVYEHFELKPDNIEWCETEDGEECKIEMPLREEDKRKSALQKVIMTDDWQGWFNGKGGTNNALKRDFPSIEVVIHNTPIQHGLASGLWVFVKSFLTIPGTPIGVGGLLNAIINIDDKINESAGFGYFHPMIPIRDLLENACGKIGLTLDANIPFAIGKALEDDCIFYPRGGEYHRRTDASCQAPDLTFKWNNRDLTTLEDFLNELCKVYKAKWQVVGTVLYFTHIKDSFNLGPVYTVTTFDNLCKKFSFAKRKGYGDYRYSVDPSDQRSNTVEIAYNDIVDYDGATNNALLEGKVDNRVNFAPTSFWGDGFGEDYLNKLGDYATIVAAVFNIIIYLTFLSAMVAAIVGVGTPIPTTCLAGPGLTVPVTASSAMAITIAAITAAMLVNIANVLIEVGNLKNRFAYDSCHRGAIEMYGTGEVSMPRIIRKKAGNPLNEARPVERQASTIAPNTFYNVNNPPFGVAWKDQFNGGYSYPYLGGTFNKDSAFNFPLFFDANYKDELYNTYHEVVDNGLFVSDTNQTRSFDIPLCCDTLTGLGVQSESTYVIGKAILVNGEKILVQEIEIDYDTFTIHITGKLII